MLIVFRKPETYSLAMNHKKTSLNLVQIYAIAQIIPLFSVLYLLRFQQQDQVVVALGRGNESLVGSALLVGLGLPLVLGMMFVTNLIVTPFIWRYKGLKQAAPMVVGGLLIIVYFLLIIYNPLH